MEQNETNVTQKQGSGTGGAILAILIAGVIIASFILISQDKMDVAVYVIATFLAAIWLLLTIRLCVDVHAIRKHLDSKEGR